MKTRLVPVLLVCVATAQALPKPTASLPADADDFLYAIRVVESGNRYYDCPTGRHGEQGPYQFRREVWRHYTTAALWEARTGLADQVAYRHYTWLSHELRRYGRPVTAWNLAAAWNGGIEAVLRGRLSPATRDYANRVTNIVGGEARLRAQVTPRFRIAFAGNN